MAKTLPLWLTKEYLEKILQKYENNPKLRVVSFDANPATAKGDNFASVMTRIILNISSQGLCRILKLILKTKIENNELAARIASESHLFEDEMTFYDKITTKFNKILRDGNCYDVLCPEAIFVDKHHFAIILEDLAEKSFTMVDRQIGLDLEHTHLCLKKIAKMHAVSAVFNERFPNVLQTFDHGFFNKHTDFIKHFFCPNLKICSEVVKDYGGAYIEYGQKLEKLIPHLMKMGQKQFEPQKDALNVLNHGDFWINNVMFAYDQNNYKPTSAILFDFQLAFWGSPAIDLHYFFNTSLQENLRMEYQAELIQYYYFELVEVLNKLKFQGYIPNLNEFQGQCVKRAFHAVLSATIFQPTMLNQHTDNANYDSFHGESQQSLNARRKAYENPRIEQNLRKLLPIFDKQGLLEVFY